MSPASAIPRRVALIAAEGVIAFCRYRANTETRVLISDRLNGGRGAL